MRLLGAGGLRGGRTRLLRRLRSAAGAARRLLARLGRLCRLRGGRRIRRLVRLRGWLGRFRLVRLFGRLRRLRGVPPLPPRSCRSGCRTCACSGSGSGGRTRPPVNTTATAPARSERISTAVQTWPQIVFRLMARPPEKKDTATIVAASAFAHNNMPRFPHHAGRASPSRSSDSRLDGRARLLRVPQ